VAAADLTAMETSIFYGSRSSVTAYGTIPDSYILLNDGRGNFNLATQQWAPALKNAGMVSSASFADFNKDGKPDLVVAGEWTAATIFLNNGRQLLPAVNNGLQNSSGCGNAL
jgi:hypothetical protein